MDEAQILRTEIQRLNVQRDAAWSERDALRAEVESLQAQLALARDALTEADRRTPAPTAIIRGETDTFWSL